MINTVSIIGLGKLGCSMAAVFADSGFRVLGFDVDLKKIEALKKGLPPVFETGLAELIKRNSESLILTDDVRSAVIGSEITFVVVPTPSLPEGDFYTGFAISAAEQLGIAIAEKIDYHVIVLTSTVLPGTSRQEIISVLEKFSGKKCGQDFGFCYSPEFIALGSVIKDLTNPDYFLIGEYDSRSGDALEFVNRRVAKKNPVFCRLTIEEAELAKIATNSFLTLKISFANYISSICENLSGCNVDKVNSAIGMDSRIGYRYLTGGLGFGGPCFPRDNLALAQFASSLGLVYQLPLFVDEFNRDYSVGVASKIAQLVGNAVKVGVIGLSYKQGSHVLEDSASIAIVHALIGQGQNVIGYDLLQREFDNLNVLKDIELASSLDDLIQNSDALVLTHRDIELANDLERAIIRLGLKIPLVDCWRIINPSSPLNNNILRLGVGR